MSLTTTCFIISLLFIEWCYSFTKLRVHAFGRDGHGKYTIAAQYLAIKMVNNDPTILNEYQLIFQPNWIKNHSNSEALSKSLALGMNTRVINDKTTINIPIVLGLPTSELSISSNPLLSYFNWAQISSSASSIQLSDDKTFPTFYRTVPADDIQAQCIIKMCLYFNWTKIGILYYNDAYGTYFTNSLLEIGNKNNIKSYSVSYVNDNASIELAADTLEDLQVYIIVLIPQSWALSETFEILEHHGLLKFPYYYIGTDGWFDKTSLFSTDVAKFSKGFVGMHLSEFLSTICKLIYNKNRYITMGRSNHNDI